MSRQFCKHLQNNGLLQGKWIWMLKQWRKLKFQRGGQLRCRVWRAISAWSTRAKMAIVLHKTLAIKALAVHDQ